MKRTNRRSASLLRVGGIVIAGLASVLVGAIGCGAKVAVDLDGSSTGAGGDGAGGTAGNGGGTLDGGCGVVPMDAGAGQLKLPECFAMPEKGCPKQYDATLYIVPSTPCVYLVSVDCGPFVSGSQCCYWVTEEMKPCN